MRKKLLDKNPRVVLLYALQVSVSFGFRPKFAITTMRKKLFDKNPRVVLYALQVSLELRVECLQFQVGSDFNGISRSRCSL